MDRTRPIGADVARADRDRQVQNQNRPESSARRAPAPAPPTWSTASTGSEQLDDARSDQCQTSDGTSGASERARMNPTLEEVRDRRAHCADHDGDSEQRQHRRRCTGSAVDVGDTDEAQREQWDRATHDVVTRSRPWPEIEK